MDNLFEKLLKALKDHDKEAVFKMVIKALEEKKVDIITLYESMLTPALNNVTDEFEDENMLIWQEHLRSEIIIAIIENAYPYVLKERDQRNSCKEKKIMVLCPKFEDHSIGARMAVDIFTIAGYEITFIGANTPWKAVLKAIEVKRPDIISMSVTNFYNLIEAKKTISAIKAHVDYQIQFILGGYAFKNSKDQYKKIGGDLYLERLKDIFLLDEDQRKCKK